MGDDVYNRLVTEFREVCEENATLQRENAALREALEWYADEANYSGMVSRIDLDEGDRARFALTPSAAPGEEA